MILIISGKETERTRGFRLGLGDFGVHRVSGATAEADECASLGGYDCGSSVGEAGDCSLEDNAYSFGVLRFLIDEVELWFFKRPDTR